MDQSRRVNSGPSTSKGQMSLFEDNNVHILDGEDRWFDSGVKEAIMVSDSNQFICNEIISNSGFESGICRFFGVGPGLVLCVVYLLPAG